MKKEHEGKERFVCGIFAVAMVIAFTACRQPTDNPPAVVAVTGVTLNTSSLSLTVGGTATLTASVQPSNASKKKVNWSSDDTGVATVTNGVVKAVAAGTVTITVATTDGNKTATCSVTVNAANPGDIAVTGVTLDQSSLSLTVGDTAPLIPAIQPNDATNQNVNWSSDDTDVATVNNGTVTAIAAGSATITVTTVDGGKTATCAVTVSAHTHEWGEWETTTPATCIATGMKERTCTLDGTTTQEVIPIDPNAHNWELSSGTAPTCTTAGSGTEKCKLCDTEKSGVIPIDPDAHDWQYLGTAPTCTQTGSGTRECRLCDYEETLNVIPVLGHDFDNWTVTTAATCTTQGVETGTCTRDGTTTTHPTAALGHQWANWIVTTPPTTAQVGVETGTCTRDVATITRDITAATFSTVAGLGTYLSSLPDNTTATAYTVKLNVSSLGGDVDTSGSLGETLSGYNVIDSDGIYSSTKYVALDLSGSTITGIEDFAFRNCASLISVIIPNSVTSIGKYAFNRTSLTSVIIPNSVTSIEWYAFDNCTSLASVTLPVNANFTSIEMNAFSSCTSLTSVIIPNSVTSIGIQAFDRCTNLASVTLPVNAGFTSIGGSAFDRTGLTSVTIPNSVTTIGSSAFQMCSKLTSVTIPNSVTTIEDSAFNRTGLTSVIIPSSVKSIGAWAFDVCTDLTSVTFQGTIPAGDFGTSYSSNVFFGDLEDVFYATNATDGTPGTYTTSAPVSATSVWTKK